MSLTAGHCTQLHRINPLAATAGPSAVTIRGGTTVRAMDEPVWCIVVAAGSGRRFGGAKQFESLRGQRVVDRSVAAARTVAQGVVVVLPAAAIGRPEGEVPGADVVVAGGDTRAASVRAGLAAVPDAAEVVLVHDAARPLATADLFGRVVAAVRGGAVAVVPVVPVADTVRDLDGEVVDRDRLRAVQTPQGFAAAALRRAHRGGGDATDDAALVQADGGDVLLVDGERTNLKLTGSEDAVVAAALLASREGVVPSTTAGAEDSTP
jgi:2-C-methyl-D-erythritol 4-phosphate cytidylyltransferase